MITKKYLIRIDYEAEPHLDAHTGRFTHVEDVIVDLHLYGSFPGIEEVTAWTGTPASSSYITAEADTLEEAVNFETRIGSLITKKYRGRLKQLPNKL